jgi:hypothetical protein
MTTRLPVPLRTPCAADFSSMTVLDARARLCAACDAVVHDVSGRTEGEIRALLAGGPA